jgi:hypothetical protein
MLQKIWVLSFFLAASAISIRAQDCRLKFSVAYSDGKTIQVGLTPDQKKMWDREGAKKFKGMCLDDKTPDFIILWNQGLNGAELAQVNIDQFNNARTTDTRNNGANAGSATYYIRPSSVVRGKAIYFVMDTSKKPYPMLHQGEGYQNVPQGTQNSPGQTINTSDVASTVPDPVEALSNALKWLKKEKKI